MVKILMSLISYVIFKNKSAIKDISILSENDVATLYKISKEHDVVGIVAEAIFSSGLLPKESEMYAKFQKQQILSVYRYEKIDYELHRICDLFENKEINFIPLKGSVLRQYYPQSWLRTSCDIDLLINEYDVDRALKVLEKEIGCTNVVRGTHDVGLFTQSGVHIELHFTLVEDGKLLNAKSILNKVWDYAYLADGCNFHYLLKDEMFYFYHIAHMAIHFQGGGCGIRPFIDLKILNQIPHDEEARFNLLSKGSLLLFREQVNKLAQVWFDNKSHDEETLRIEEYIIKSGVYGTSENYIATQQVQKGNRFKYLMSRIWLPYNVLKYQYPSLNGKKFLLPIYEIRRWFKMLFGGRLKHSINEIKISRTISNEKSNEVNILLKQLGLIE